MRTKSHVNSILTGVDIAVYYDDYGNDDIRLKEIMLVSVVLTALMALVLMSPIMLVHIFSAYNGRFS